MRPEASFTGTLLGVVVVPKLILPKLTIERPVDELDRGGKVQVDLVGEV